jgi:uncharacterized protein (UPF0332 family)
MKNLAESLIMLGRAEDAILTAEHDLKAGFVLATVNRSYYSIYYCISALLYTEDIYAKSHKGTHAKYDEIFIKTGKMPLITTKYVSNSFNLRQEADYDLDANVTEAEAQILIDNAREFYELAKNYLGQFG